MEVNKKVQELGCQVREARGLDPLSPHETIKHAVTELRTQLVEVIYATWKNGFPCIAAHSPISQNLLVL